MRQVAQVAARKQVLPLRPRQKEQALQARSEVRALMEQLRMLEVIPAM